MADAVAPAAPAAVTIPPGAAGVESSAPTTDQPAGSSPPAVASGAVPEPGSGPGSAAKRLFKITVDGSEQEYDASDDNRVKADIQKGRHWEKRGQELQRKWSVVEQAMANAQKNPAAGMRELAQALGLDPLKASQEMVAEELRRQIREDELAALSPEERQRLMDQEELEKYRASEKQKAEDDKKRQEAEKVQKLQEQITQKLDSAIDFGLKGTSLEGDPYAMYQFASLVQACAEDVLAGKLKEMPHPKQIAGYLEHNLKRLAGKYAPTPVAAPPPEKPRHPAARRGPVPPKGVTPARNEKGQFTGFAHRGTQIYEEIAKVAESAPRKLRLGLPPGARPA